MGCGQQGVAFGGGEQVEVVDGLVGVPGGLVEQVDQVAGELADGGGVEQLGAVEEVAGDGVGVVGEVEGEIEAGGGVAAWEVAGGDAGGGDGGGAGGGLGRGLDDVVVEGDLEERVAAAVAGGGEVFDEVLEGQVLMVVGVQAGAADLVQQLGEGGVVVQAGPDHQGVDEEADQGEGWGLAAVGDEGADRDVVLAAVAGQQGLESGQRGHEHGGVLGAGEPA